MPCIAPVRGKTDAINPWEPITDNDPCGMPVLVSVDGVNVSAQNLCAMHYQMKYGSTGAAALVMDAPGLSGSLMDSGQPGLYAPATGPWAANTAVAGLAGRTYLARLVAPRACRVVSIKFVTSLAATNDDPCDVGIYSGAASTPFTLLGSSGSTSGKMNAVAGIQTVPLLSPVQLQAGQVYFAALLYGTVGGTAANIVMTNSARYLLVAMFGSFTTYEAASGLPGFPLASLANMAGFAPSQNTPVLALVEG